MFTMNEAEDVLQQLNALRGNDNATNTALSRISSIVKNAIGAADDQGGVFAAPRNLAAQRFKLQDMVPALKAAADGDINADRFVSQYLFNGETKDVKALAEVLKSTNPEMFQQARSQFGQELMRKAYGENPAADAAIKPAQLASALRQFGSEKLKAFFTPGEIEQLRRVSWVGAYMESIPSAAPVNTSNTMTAGLPFLAQLPGVDKLALALRAGAAIGRGVGNERTVSNAISAKVPLTAAEMSPQTKAMLARALMMGGGGVGMATATGINQ
jgi:hypothetical protein